MSETREIESLKRRVEALEEKEFAVMHVTTAAPAHTAAEGVLCWDATNNVNNWTALN
jgi:hypothetical protein